MIGGDHYVKLGIEPWQIIDTNKMDFYEGSVLKYLMRHKRKAGAQDLLKAIDVLQKMVRDYDEIYTDVQQPEERDNDRCASSIERSHLR